MNFHCNIPSCELHTKQYVHTTTTKRVGYEDNYDDDEEEEEWEEDEEGDEEE